MAQKVNGVYQRLPQGGGFLRDPALSFQPGPQDTWVSSQLIRQFGLTNGADVKGSADQTKKGLQLVTIDSICDLEPEQFKTRTRFEKLLAINPKDRIQLAKSGNISMRIVDLIAPIGKGTRGLIVSPPKSGKTQLLEDMANAIYTCEPEIRIIVLLIDERPEEVTHFRRNVHGEVLASSSDQSIESHVNLAELTMAHIRCELESGRDVVVLLDSITRMARAFNIHGSGSGRTMSGGLDARALEIPRRFFGLARNIENGGSVTVMATAQIDTGSRMDGYIFEEFKSTGNSEIVLDRSLAEARIFPAINLLSSGTRREELLYSEKEMQLLDPLRRWMADYEPKAAMRGLIKLVSKTPTNSKLIDQFKSILE
ncbi:MAG: transcription termination factor Rho [Calditrichia bacterium]|nr:transcription termination factor Rho [Calditrichia bacterium]